MTVSGMFVAGMLLGLALMQQPWHMWLFVGAGRAVAIAGVQFGTTVAIANWFVHQRGRAAALVGFGHSARRWCRSSCCRSSWR